ncbi:MAG TPA: division/cell wall cluster transcriptional repressor MraZ [bacterium]|nr:division/cell wall cluster transcriptional repressor MraZ [bacterium]
MGHLFRGEHHYSLDDKGRVVIPPKFRRSLGDTAVVTRGLDECVALYAPTEWAKNEKKLQAQAVARRDFVRFMLSSAEDVELDRQGRISIPQHLREYAKIEREAVVVGVGSRIEIWGLENWKRYIAKIQAEAPTLASGLQDLSI